MYGLKGLCAYAHHAEALGHTDPRVYADVQRQLHFLCSPAAASVPDVLDACFAAGATNFRVMEMLSNAHSSTFGHPVPTPVSLNPLPGKAILVTGHDMHDMHMLLEQTQVGAGEGRANGGGCGRGDWHALVCFHCNNVLPYSTHAV